MTREIVAYEGKRSVNGYLLHPGALKWDEEALIPVTEHFDWTQQTAWVKGSDIRREDDGSITAEMGDIEVPEHQRVTIYCTQLITEEEQRGEITSGELKGLSLIAAYNWPYPDETRLSMTGRLVPDGTVHLMCARCLKPAEYYVIRTRTNGELTAICLYHYTEERRTAEDEQ